MHTLCVLQLDEEGVPVTSAGPRRSPGQPGRLQKPPHIPDRPGAAQGACQDMGPLTVIFET